jgi:fluoroquinolone resistance protein
MTFPAPGPGDLVSDASFDQAAWPEADLTGVRFVRCRLPRVNLSHADLREAVFQGCQFGDAETHQGANFAFARIDEASFEDCHLAHARFEGADLYAARFQSCRLLGARFGRARFHRAFGRRVVRASVAFHDCDLTLADLSGANLAGCDLSRSRLRECDLSGADLSEATLAGVDLFQAILDGARLTGADLRGAEVSGLDLRRLADYRDLIIGADQQYRLLDALGLDVRDS